MTPRRTHVGREAVHSSTPLAAALDGAAALAERDDVSWRSPISTDAGDVRGSARRDGAVAERRLGLARAALSAHEVLPAPHW
jgi:hypothetical protein